MAKTRQVLKLEAEGQKFTVIYHEECVNPFWVYQHTREHGQYGWRERKRIQVKYADIQSCLYYLMQAI